MEDFKKKRVPGPGVREAEPTLLVYHQLQIAKVLEENLKKLQSASSCKFKVIRLPALFRWDDDAMLSWEQYDYFPKEAFVQIGHNLNGVVLRNHVLFGKGIFDSIIVDRLANALGGRNFVHPLDLYRTVEMDGAGRGSAHCGTNTIRDPLYRFSR